MVTPANPVPPFDAASVVGHLADADRRRVFAAVALGAADPGEVASMCSDLSARTIAAALHRLEGTGLVERDPSGRFGIADDRLRATARDLAERANADATGDGSEGTSDGGSDDPDVARVLRAFVKDGRLVSIPAVHSKRLVILDRLAQEFEPGRHYRETMVNLILGRWYADTAALRRYLVDEGFLDRDQGWYWRSGGSFPNG